MIWFLKLPIIASKFHVAWSRSRCGCRIASLGIILSAVMALTAPSIVRADVLQISGLGFIGHSEFDGLSLGKQYQGRLRKLADKYYAPVPFPRSGDRVCKLSVIFRDSDARTLTATLYKKLFKAGSSAFESPKVMATVHSDSADGVTRIKRTKNISYRVVNLSKAFYFVEIDVGCCTETDIELYGVQIEHSAGPCP